MEQKSPILKTLNTGTYYVCTCHQSKNFPFCDGSHVATDKTPTKMVLDEPNTVAICSCGKSQKGIYCDGSHVKKDNN